MKSVSGLCLSAGIILATLFCSAALAVPALPAINTNNVIVVTNAPYNAAGDGVTDNTLAISNAIVKAATGGQTNGGWGGTVEIPGPGTYLCGPLTFKSSVNLQVDAGATLMMLPKASWPGTTTFIYGTTLTNLEISGSGTIDGQGAGWWGSSSRPNFIQFDKSHRILFQNIKLQNPPTFTLYLKNGNGEVTINGINIDTVSTSPNTDGMDIGSTNMLIENSHISDGDDNIEIGGSTYQAGWITITNCVFGSGHGVSCGSDINGGGNGVHDVTVINCIFTNTQNGIKIKSDNDRGGLVQNMFYYNLSMTNLTYAPILFYGYYNTYGANATSKGITPAIAASSNAVALTATEPAYRNIIISNLTATCAQPGMIWARTEYPATNIFMQKLNITASDSGAGNGSFAIYNARGVTVADSTITVAGSRKTFELFDAQAVFSNSVTGGSAISLDGLAVTNPLAFYNLNASLSDASFFGATALAIGGSTVSNATSLTLGSGTSVAFTVGTNTSRLIVAGNLTLNSTLNITNGAGFAPGTNLLFTCTGALAGTPVLGTTPKLHSYSYSLRTNSQAVSLVIAAPAAPHLGNTATAGTNFIFNVTGGVTNGFCYVVSTTNLALPLNQWTIISTNFFDANGTCSVTNYPAGQRQTFYQLEIP